MIRTFDRSSVQALGHSFGALRMPSLQGMVTIAGVVVERGSRDPRRLVNGAVREAGTECVESLPEWSSGYTREVRCFHGTRDPQQRGLASALGDEHDRQRPPAIIDPARHRDRRQIGEVGERRERSERAE